MDRAIYLSFFVLSKFSMSDVRHYKQRNWFNKHRNVSNLILVLISTSLAFFLCEFALRLSGKKPGYLPRYRNFKPVNQLEVYQNFITDDEGVFKANSNYEWPEHIKINSDGFRSIEFKRYKTSRPKILFLGDSFTWGSSAKPITNCFVDIVSKRGYLTFNTGIGGTGPNQYAYIAEKYIPLLKPDIVAVMFYMGNDLNTSKPMLPYKNPWHATNAGWIKAYDESGNYMSAQEAYDYYLARYGGVHVKYTTNSLEGRIREVFMRSAVGSYFWISSERIKSKLTDRRAKNNVQIENQTKIYLSRIRKVSEEYNARFMLFLIPVHPGIRKKSNSVEDNLFIFEDFESFIPHFLIRSDYMDLPNDHFNNSGHRKYAEFILRTLESKPQ